MAAWILDRVLAHLGNVDYGEPIGKEFRSQIEAKFFAHYLKDAPGKTRRRIRPQRHGQLSDRFEHLEALCAFSAARRRRPPACILQGAGS
jgi:hypothetical protein